MDFLARIENSGFSTWIRESPSVMAYPLVLFLHTLGLGILVGVNAAVDLRVLGFAPRLPMRPMTGLFPLMYAGFWINAASGVVLLAIDATTMPFNPVFIIKMTFIVLAVVNVRILRKHVFGDPFGEERPTPMSGKILACTSLFLWAGAITAGRLTAYLGK
jgi:hypothetical protein